MNIRKMGLADVEPALLLFYDTVHAINARDYTEREINAMAPEDLSTVAEKLKVSIKDGYAFAALIDDQLVGFADMNRSGYLDHCYVHKDFQRQGIAAALLAKRLKLARELGLKEVHCHASITAKPFFEHFGFTLIAKNTVLCRGVYLVNYHMRLKL